MPRTRRSAKSWLRSGRPPGSREERSPARQPRPTWLIAVAALSALAAAAALGIPLAFVLSGGGEPERPPRAIIVDQLSLTFPSADFRREASRPLREDGYTVDYVAGEDVTVDFFRHLPEQGYDLVVLRAHAARIQGEYRGEQLDEAVIFTNEPYREADPNDPASYFEEQLEARLDVAYAYEGAPRYFGITADFVEFSMEGDFNGATVIMMGCEGLASNRTAEAFVNKGAAHYISWNNTVSATHTDAATERLLQLMVGEGLDPGRAVARTMRELGPDPTYESVLRAYGGGG